MKQQVEDRLHERFVRGLEDPPTQSLTRADDELWSITSCCADALNRRAERDRWMTKAWRALLGWLLGRSKGLAPMDVRDWRAYRERVRRNVLRLTPEERRAVMLARFGSPQEIAVWMDVSVESVRKYLRRGYLKLMGFGVVDDT